jgi:hypothetical protein
MANTNIKKNEKDTKKVETPNVKKVEIAEVNSDPKDEIILKLQEQINNIQQAFINMQSNQKTEIKSENTEVYGIGTRFVNGVTIFSPRKEIEKEIPFNKNIEVDKNELDMLLKSNFVKDWFEKDILFFTNENVYSQRKIKKQFDLSDENLIDIILNHSTKKVMDVITDMTKRFKDDPVIHCIFYRIVELCSNGKLSTMPYETRREIEKAFSFKIDDAQMLFRGFRELK